MNTKWMKALVGLSGILMLAALYLIFVYVPTDANMGIVQRIFYVHVPLSWVAFLAFFVVFLSSIFYLVKRDQKWDRLAVSSAEVGVVFTTLCIIAGSIWAKPAWGVWWAWDPRLTSTLVLWLIYIAYLLIRSYVTDKEQGARFSAVIGIFGFLDVPIVALAITLWPTDHPSPLIFEGGLVSSMLLTLIIGIFAFSSLYFMLLFQKLTLKKMEDDLRDMKDWAQNSLPVSQAGELRSVDTIKNKKAESQ
jgi:heme exporter protein C